MKNFLCGWIIFQLIVIGLTHATLLNKIEDKTLNCSAKTTKFERIFSSVVSPLVYFMQPPEYVDKYCKSQN